MIKPIMTDPVNEALVILAEECAEVTKEVTKIQRFGLDHVGPGREISARAALAHECGQLRAMIEILEQAGVLPRDVLDSGVMDKKLKLEKWSNLPPEWLWS